MKGNRKTKIDKSEPARQDPKNLTSYSTFKVSSSVYILGVIHTVQVCMNEKRPFYFEDCTLEMTSWTPQVPFCRRRRRLAVESHFFFFTFCGFGDPKNTVILSSCKNRHWQRWPQCYGKAISTKTGRLNRCMHKSAHTKTHETIPPFARTHPFPVNVWLCILLPWE